MKARQDGMALLIVLWLIVLLGIMASGHARNVHNDTQLASRQLEAAKARGLAEAGINHVVLQMLSERGLEIPVDGSVFAVTVHDEPVTIAVRQASGLVDLNRGKPDLLDAVLRAAGMDSASRPRTVDAILDWRDRDSLRHLDGVEDADYLAAGLPWTARDGFFAAIDELKYIPGIGEKYFASVAPLVTIHSGRAGIDLELAPPALVAALNGSTIEPATQDDTAVQRRGTRVGTFHVYASVAAGSGTLASVEAVVTTSRSAKQPVTIREWREPPRQVLPPLAGDGG